MRLKGEAHFAEVVEELLVHTAFEMPRQDIVVEEVPIVPGRDARADAGPWNDQPLGGKRLHRFAKNRARHLEARGELRISGQDRPDRELA
ncbi:hypothetical protein FQZ97_1224870 [compost metagenome]